MWDADTNKLNVPADLEVDVPNHNWLFKVVQGGQGVNKINSDEFAKFRGI